MIFCIHLGGDVHISWREERKWIYLWSSCANEAVICVWLGVPGEPSTQLAVVLLPCTFLPSLSCASSVTRPAGRQLRKLNWLKRNLPQIYFLLALLHEAAHHGDRWEPGLTCGQEQQESPWLYLQPVLLCRLWTAGVWPPERWLRVFLSSLAILLSALPACPPTLRYRCLVSAIPSSPLLPWHPCNSPSPPAKCCSNWRGE